MKKTWLLILCGIVITTGCTRVNTNSNSTTSVSSNDPIPYDQFYGTVCPLGVKFLASKKSPTVDCDCPDGYTKDSTMFGSSTGDACYGPGTECPMFAVTCITK